MNEELGKERILEVLDRISKFLSQDERIWIVFWSERGASQYKVEWITVDQLFEDSNSNNIVVGREGKEVQMIRILQQL